MKYRRYDFEATEENVTVCRGEHDKGQPCEYEVLSTYEIVEILNDMRSKLLKVHVLLQETELVKLELRDK